MTSKFERLPHHEGCDCPECLFDPERGWVFLGTYRKRKEEEKEGSKQ